MYFDLLLDKTLKNAKDVFKVCQHLRKFSYSWYISQLRQELVALVVLHVCQSVYVYLCVLVCVCWYAWHFSFEFALIFKLEVIRVL